MYIVNSVDKTKLSCTKTSLSQNKFVSKQVWDKTSAWIKASSFSSKQKSFFTWRVLREDSAGLDTDVTWKWSIISNYWMRLSRTWRILQNSSYPTKAEFNNCFNIHSKYILLLKGVSPLRSLFFRSPNITQPCPQVFSVNGSIICSGLHFWRHFDAINSIIFGGLHFWRHWFNMAKILSKFGEQQLVMVNYACGFNQSETGKYFEWILKQLLNSAFVGYEEFCRILHVLLSLIQ